MGEVVGIVHVAPRNVLALYLFIERGVATIPQS